MTEETLFFSSEISAFRCLTALMYNVPCMRSSVYVYDTALFHNDAIPMHM